jgi:hypothetical protein
MKMEIMVESDSFNMNWEKSTTAKGWGEFEVWFEKALNEGYEYEDGDSNEPSGYPRVRVKTDLPQLLVIGVCYGSGLQFGNVLPNGEFRALWYCAPSLEKFYAFLDNLRIAEHNFVGGSYGFGSPAWEAV